MALSRRQLDQCKVFICPHGAFVKMGRGYPFLQAKVVSYQGTRFTEPDRSPVSPCAASKLDNPTWQPWICKPDLRGLFGPWGRAISLQGIYLDAVWDGDSPGPQPKWEEGPECTWFSREPFLPSARVFLLVVKISCFPRGLRSCGLLSLGFCRFILGSSAQAGSREALFSLISLPTGVPIPVTMLMAPVFPEWPCSLGKHRAGGES